MDSDEFVARMIAAGIPDIEMSATQPASPKIKPAPAPTAPTPGASLIPAGPQDSVGLTPQPSQASLASVFALPSASAVRCHMLVMQSSC